VPCRFPGIPTGLLCGDTASEESLLRVKWWISHCCSSHEQCSTGSLTPLPKRVIDVDLQSPRLYETNNDVAQYVCLSHYWGTSRPRCLTKSKTLEANLRGIEMEAMLKPFRDAIDFTQRLGIRFVWIDSLCILQLKHVPRAYFPFTDYFMSCEPLGVTTRQVPRVCLFWNSWTLLRNPCLVHIE
jgi:hypothetical protein